MAKTAVQFVCQTCSTAYPKWSGRCDGCGAWNSLVESAAAPARGRSGSAGPARAVATTTLESVDLKRVPRLATGMADVDQVLGGGIVPGSVMLLSGDPGIGKSTLVLQLAASLAAARPVLYVSGEESASQIKLRADRLSLGSAGLELLTDTDADNVAATVATGKYGLVIIDSIQTMSVSSLTGAAGSVGQITASAQALQEAAKRHDTAMIIIGHVTKEGSIAGPKILEHLVDVVLYLEGDRFGHFKALRGIKNRFGSTNEVGIFEMTDAGLSIVSNPSEALLAERQPGPGSVVLPTIEGTRPLLVEVQALTSNSVFGYPKRTAAGFDLNRLNLLIAVLQKRAGLNLSAQDIYVNIVGGLKVTEPAADLAIILSIASAFKYNTTKLNAAVFGEVGLNGEIRSVGNVSKRLLESKKLGFDRVIGPVGTKDSSYTGVRTVQEAITAAFEVQ